MLYNLFENRDFVSVFAVALLAEGVDRNHHAGLQLRQGQESPSSRRAWIEMPPLRLPHWQLRVALLAEGVDRNLKDAVAAKDSLESPSSRRAWIEISKGGEPKCRMKVALLAEGVDRNDVLMCSLTARASRPPRGGRG